ncbi:MAG: DUF1858 domain-containing protein [Bacteroidetes bacterium]|nr:DUF1858 domain-containing protein [Bacteroidota bacterium]
MTYYKSLKITKKTIMKITKEITIEELVEIIPESVRYLMEKGIRCIACGEPIWGTLEEAAKEKGFNENQIEEFVKDLNKLT